MDFYSVLRGCLAWFTTIACLFPVNVPWLYLSFRINEGAVDESKRMDSDELWKRSLLAAFMLALMTLGFLVADSLLAQWLEFPAELTHPIILFAYVPAAVWLLTYYFSYEDAVEGVTLALIYLFMPMIVLGGLNWIVPFWNPLLNLVYPWIQETTAT